MDFLDFVFFSLTSFMTSTGLTPSIAYWAARAKLILFMSSKAFP